jgi:hypothetical protein
MKGELESEAKEVLRAAGYFVDNLWSIEDVKSMYDCTDEEAYEVLDEALRNDFTMEQIWTAIRVCSEEINLKLKT